METRNVKVDLHNHLRTSSIFRNRDFNKTIDIVAKRLGKGGILGLINFSDKRYEAFIGLKGYDRDYVGKNKNGIYIPDKDVLIVKGQEVPTKQGHLLVLGLEYETHLKGKRPFEDTLKEARDNNGIILVDHPFYLSGLGEYLENNLELLKNIDAIETHNGEAAFGFPIGPFPYQANKKAQEFYERVKSDYPHLGAIASSDGHSMYEIASSWTEIEMPKFGESCFIDSLRESIRKTNLDTPNKMKGSVVGTIDHMTDLTFIVKIAPKIGLGRFFETERPE